MFSCIRATNKAGHLRVIQHSGSFARLRPASCADGHTVECAVVTLFIVVYNYAQLFTIIARRLQFLAWPVLLWICAELITCISVLILLTLADIQILGIFTPSQCRVTGDLRTIFCTQYVDKLGRFGQQIRNTWKVLKCGAGEGWRRSVGPIM